MWQALCLLLLGCGVAEAVAGASPGVTGRYSSASNLLVDFGEPCTRNGPPTALQVWTYCAGECAPSQQGQVCIAPCTTGCQKHWVFHVIGDVVLSADGPGD